MGWTCAFKFKLHGANDSAGRFWPETLGQPEDLSRAACLVHPNAQVCAIQFGVIVLYISYKRDVVSVVSIAITSCPESFHILPRAGCLAPYPGSACQGPVQPVCLPCASGMMSTH